MTKTQQRSLLLFTFKLKHTHTFYHFLPRTKDHLSESSGNYFFQDKAQTNHFPPQSSAHLVPVITNKALRRINQTPKKWFR